MQTHPIGFYLKKISIVEKSTVQTVLLDRLSSKKTLFRVNNAIAKTLDKIANCMTIW